MISAARGVLLAMFSAMILLAAPLPAAAKGAPVHTSWRNNLAISGYDPLSYFEGKPLKGKADYTAQYKGAKWRFTSAANRDLFLTNPEAFAPKYGGYCAWALAKGKLAPGKPRIWHIEDGQLYLNFNARVQRQWNLDRAEFIDTADDRWPDILAD